MDLKDFKKIDVTRTHTIFQHPDGHIIHVMHDKLDPAARKQMRDIPIEKKPLKLAEGTPEEPIQEQPSPEDRLKELAAEPPKSEIKPIPVEEMNTQVEPENFPIPQAAQPQEQPTVSPTIGAETALLGSSQQIAGQEALGRAEAENIRAQQQATAENLKNLQNVQQNIANTHATYRKRVEDSIKAMSEHPDIDPNRYLGKMDTGGRVLTAIGLILGGMGAGLTGGPNQALQYLQTQIDRDIEAQRLGVEKKRSLYTANLQMLKDEDAAAEMTRAQMLEMAKLKLNQAALQSADKAAIARSQVAIGALTAAQEGPLSRLAQSQVMSQMAAQPMQNPAVVRTYIEMLPKQQQKDATREYDRYSDIVNINETIIPEMERIANLGIAGKALSFKERADIENLNKKLLTVSGKLASSPDFKLRFSKQLADLLTRPYQISPYSLKVTDLEKLKNLKKALSDAQNKSSKILKGYKINVPSSIAAVPIETVK